MKYRAVAMPCAIAALVLLLLCSPVWPVWAEEGEIELTLPPPMGAELSEGRLNTLKDSIVETGIGRDAISSIDAPVFIDIEDAALAVDDDEVVFVARYGPDDVRIYPHSVMVWHQVVNDTTDQGERVAVTYCPLTGSLVGYRATVGRFTTNFGVTGLLVNNNTVLYDRATNSQWPQLLGVAIDGPLKGKKLERFPMLWSRFRRAAEAYPRARVLSRATGFRRNYGRDPYGNYRIDDSYYHDGMIVYPLVNWDKRLPPKDRVLTLQTEGGEPFAVRDEAIRQGGVLDFWAELLPLAGFWDPALGTARIFKRELEGHTLEFEMVAGQIRDKESRSVWSPEGDCVSGAWYGRSLERYPSNYSFWFAFAAFHPTVKIVPEPAEPWRE